MYLIIYCRNRLMLENILILHDISYRYMIQESVQLMNMG